MIGGFPRVLHEIKYPAHGDPGLASRVKQLLAPTPVAEDTSEWGLDHGTWSVLRHVYPKADIPVVQMSLDASQPPSYQDRLAKGLAPLRDEGVLIMGTGNILHNLQAMRAQDAAPFDWAVRFDEAVRSHLAAGNHQPPIELDRLGADVRQCVPTPAHYMPLLYVIAQQRPEEGSIAFLTQGIELGAISMLSVAVGAAAGP